jgi:hypothetical protein
MIGQELTTRNKSALLLWEGRRLPMQLTPSGWRLRARSRHLTVDYCTGIQSLKLAQDAARRHLDERKAGALVVKSGQTLADVVRVYRELPKLAGLAAEKISIYRLTSVVRLVTGKELAHVDATAINAKFWLAYIAKRQGRTVPDIASRAPINSAINSAMRAAAAVFKPRLQPLYAEHGIIFSPDVTAIQWLARMKLPKPKAKVDELALAWSTLHGADQAMWWSVGLARYAGLRRDEVAHATAAWVEIDGAATYIRVCDRPDEDWNSKTGENYRALVIHPALAAALRAAPAGLLVPDPARHGRPCRPMTRQGFFKSAVQAWCKPFTGAATKPMHRLRGLYADELAKLTEDAVKARLEGQRAAAAALGHTTTATTVNHYLSD